MKKICFVICLYLSCGLHQIKAQEKQGIAFVQGLSWAQIKEKAKSENRYNYLYIYGHLLYKSGKSKRAIEVFNNLIKLTGDPDKHLFSTLNKIKKKEKTWK